MIRPPAIADFPLLAPIEPSPADLARPVGLIEGPAEWWEGFGAGLRCWTGPVYGWRQLGDLTSLPAVVGRPPAGVIIVHKGTMRIGLTWDLGKVSYKALQRGGLDGGDEG